MLAAVLPPEKNNSEILNNSLIIFFLLRGACIIICVPQFHVSVLLSVDIVGTCESCGVPCVYIFKKGHSLYFFFFFRVVQRYVSSVPPKSWHKYIALVSSSSPKLSQKSVFFYSAPADANDINMVSLQFFFPLA